MCSKALKHAEEALKLYNQYKPGVITQSVAFTYTMLAWKAFKKTDPHSGAFICQTNIGAPCLSKIIPIDPKTIIRAFGTLEKVGLIEKVFRLGITNETIVCNFPLEHLEVFLNPPPHVVG